MSTYLSIGQTAKKLGVSIVTIRRWDKKCKLKSSFRTIGGHRRFKLSLINKILGVHKSKTKVGYARVSAYDQKNDFNSQMGVLKKHTHFLFMILTLVLILIRKILINYYLLFLIKK